MADVISFADWTAMQEILEADTQMVSGMSAAEAQIALGASKGTNNLYLYNTTRGAGAGNVIDFPGKTAAEAAAEYIEAGGTVSEAGAATASTGAAQSTANVALTEGATAGKAGVAGVLSMSLPTAFAAIAPVAGVAVGVGLYELSPTFWETVSRTLLPFCYPDTELMPVMVDEYGTTYYPSGAIDALKSLISQIPITEVSRITDPEVQAQLDNPNRQSLNFISNPADPFVRYRTAGGRYLLRFTVRSISGDDPIYAVGCDRGSMDERCVVWVSKSQFSGVVEDYNESTHSVVATRSLLGDQTITVDGVRYYHTYTSTGVDRGNQWFQYPNQDYETFEMYPSYTSNPVTISIKDIILFLYGGDIHAEGYPEGMDKWTGNEYPEEVTPLKVVTDIDEETGEPTYTPYYPVHTPVGDPGATDDPEDVPDPTANPDPDESVSPWTSPLPQPYQWPWDDPSTNPAPLTDPVPDPQPVPDPATDPAEETDEPPSDPTSPTRPIDNGIAPIPIVPEVPVLPSKATGLLHVYNPSQGQIDAFGQWLWTTFSGSLIETLSKLFNDPMDAVIGLHELYATPATSGGATIRCGYLDSGVSASYVGSRYTTINCGSVVVEEYYQNYLDYSPYTQAFIYLPFIGIVQVCADDIIGNAVNITYHVDSYTGSCIAVVSVARDGYEATVYQYNGNCAVEIPISSGYQSTLVSGLLGMAGVALSGNPVSGLAAAHVGRAGLGKNNVQHSGSFGSSYGAMGAKIPYIIVRRPTQKKVYNYAESYGYPAHKMVFVGNCSGYLRCREVRVKSTTATNVEKEMIVNALKAGVYVR